MKKIAIIGTGISGMAAGYFLRNDYDITFFEKNGYAGGHTNTLMVDEDGDQISMDSAFMVYNEVTYPNLTRLFHELQVETCDTNMSFSVQHLPSGLEYCGTGLNGLFAQRRNIVNPMHYKMLMDISRFNKESIEVLDNNKYTHYSLEQYFKEKQYGRAMLDKYLIPMSSAVWSTPVDNMLQFPIATLVQFFKNHGFLGMDTQHQWRTVVGGSRNYRDKILKYFEGKVLTNTPITAIRREKEGIKLKDASDQVYSFDKAIIASHADQTLQLLVDATAEERSVLKMFPYLANRATLHADASIMPKCRGAWSSWNYRMRQTGEDIKTTTIYHMNSLQNVSQKKDYFMSINELGEINPDKVIWERTYYHPLYTMQSIDGQRRLEALNDNGQIYFAGAYFKYGFHEDGLNSGINVARKILGREVWS